MLKQATIYARVSTNSQDCEMQLKECREYCARKGWPVAAEYVESGQSGSLKSRPDLDKMLAQVRRRKFDAVVVYRFDRFARSSAQLIMTLDEFRELGVDFASIHEAVDTSTPTGRAMFTILAAFAELERETIKERVKSGVQQAREKGVRLGRPPRVWDRQKAQDLIASGLKIEEVAQALGVGRATMYREISRVAHRSGPRPQ